MLEMDHKTIKKQTPLEYLLVFVRGLAMGAADIVPGVSGGTIAFLTGIYDRLVDAIKSVNLEAFRLFFSGKWKKLWVHIDGTFLVSLVAGIGTSLLSLAKLMEYLLKFHPVPVWSFFFGLVLASTVIVLLRITKWSLLEPALFIAGTAAAWLITSLNPVQTPDNLLFTFLSGAIAICAMILPGISGSLILVILGKYSVILGALNDRNILVVAVFLLGCLVGITSFSRLLSILLKKLWNQTVAVLAGFMLGSLNKVWPWKRVLETYTDRHGEVHPLIERNILPGAYERLTGMPPQALLAAFMVLAGLAVVIVIELVSMEKTRSAGGSAPVTGAPPETGNPLDPGQ
jgi:putative membrane protein